MLGVDDGSQLGCSSLNCSEAGLVGEWLALLFDAGGQQFLDSLAIALKGCDLAADAFRCGGYSTGEAVLGEFAVVDLVDERLVEPTRIRELEVDAVGFDVDVHAQRQSLDATDGCGLTVRGGTCEPVDGGVVDGERPMCICGHDVLQLGENFDLGVDPLKSVGVPGDVVAEALFCVAVRRGEAFEFYELFLDLGQLDQFG